MKKNNSEDMYMSQTTVNLLISSLIIAIITSAGCIGLPIYSIKTGVDIMIPWAIVTVTAIVSLFGFMAILLKGGVIDER